MDIEQEVLHQLKTHQIEKLRYKIVKVYPHDRTCFTEGLVYKDGYIYESCGLYGYSRIQKVELKTGKVVQEKKINYFGEGLTYANNRFYQLTWKEHLGLIYNERFELIDTWRYTTQGWGLTFKDGQFIMSDGSANLHIYDDRLKYVKSIKVKIGDYFVRQLNCLATDNRYLYTNLFPTDLVLKIDLNSGHIIGYLDFSEISPRIKYDYDDVLNGITFDDNKRLYLTGKRWSKLYQVELTG